MRGNSKILYRIVAVLAVVAVGLSGFLAWRSLFEAKEAVAVQAAEEAELQAELQKETSISIVCAGDVMMHTPQLEAQRDASTGKYDCRNNFQYVKPYIEEADLALFNLETTFAGKPYTGYPTFSAPEALATALKDAGFDVAITANNHMMDKGLDGVHRTLKILNEKGLIATGSVLQKEDPRYIIQDVNGIKIGIVAYTFETGSGQGSTSINGELISDEAADNINSFNFHTLGEDLPKIQSSIDGARQAGADAVIVYYHWGEEFQQKANKQQKELAQKTADMGADVIFASHPHVLQQTTYLTAAGSGKEVPVFYSMGNFISNQRSETVNNRYTEQGLIAKVELTYSKKDGVKAITMDGIPTWVDKYSSGGKFVFEIIPLDAHLKDNEALAVSGHLSRAQQALEDTNGILELTEQQN